MLKQDRVVRAEGLDASGGPSGGDMARRGAARAWCGDAAGTSLTLPFSLMRPVNDETEVVSLFITNTVLHAHIDMTW